MLKACCTSCRSSFTTEDDKGLACQILFANEDALPSLVADTVKYKGAPSPGTTGTLKFKAWTHIVQSAHFRLSAVYIHEENHIGHESAQ